MSPPPAVSVVGREVGRRVRHGRAVRHDGLRRCRRDRVAPAAARHYCAGYRTPAVAPSTQLVSTTGWCTWPNRGTRSRCTRSRRARSRRTTPRRPGDARHGARRGHRRRRRRDGQHVRRRARRTGPDRGHRTNPQDDLHPVDQPGHRTGPPGPVSRRRERLPRAAVDRDLVAGHRRAAVARRDVEADRRGLVARLGGQAPRCAGEDGASPSR